MRPRTRYSSVGSRPIVRLLAGSLAFTLIFIFLRRSHFSTQSTGLSSARNVSYEFPHDVILPQSYDRDSRKPQRIGKATLNFHHDDSTFLRALKTHELHNERYGYPLFMLQEPLVEGNFSKPAFLLSIILDELRKPEGHRLKWIFWTDVETVLMNPKVPLDVFLPPEEYSDIHLLATADGNGVNAGAFFIKVHPWSVGLLEAVVSFPLYRPHIDLEHYDQTALKELLRDKEFRHNYMFAPQRWFNAYVKELYDSRRPWQMNPGDLLVHFPNLPHNQDEMWVLLDRSQMHLREFEVEYESTTYSKEIPEFWASQHDKQITQKGEAREAAKDADVLLKRTTSQLKMHRNDMNQEDTGNIEQQMAALRLSLREQEDNKEATMLYYQRLQQASGVLHILAAKGREALIKRAEAIMSSSKEHFKPLNDDLHEDAKKDLFGKLNLLHKLLTDSSIDDTQLLSTVEDLELMTAEMDVMIRERDIGNLT